MILSFHPCFADEIQIILKDRDLNSDDLALIQEAEVIILPQSCQFDLYQACKNSSALIFPNYEARFEYPGKIGQSLLFQKLKCPHPETIQWPSVDRFRKEYRKAGNFPHNAPFLIKADRGHEAEGIYLVAEKRALESALENLASLEKSGFLGFITQDLIPSGGDVLRAVIIGGRTITYWKRPKKPGQIITTVSQGASIDRDWRTDLQEKGRVEAERFSAATGINLAAIDFIFSFSHPDPQPLFLEVNYYFGRRGLGGSLNYYHLLLKAIQEWLFERGFEPKSVRLF